MTFDCQKLGCNLQISDCLRRQSQAALKGHLTRWSVRDKKRLEPCKVCLQGEAYYCDALPEDIRFIFDRWAYLIGETGMPLTLKAPYTFVTVDGKRIKLVAKEMGVK